MIQNYSIWRVLRVFFDDPIPREGFTIRWISREIGLAPTSVRLHLRELASQDKPGFPLVTRSRGLTFPVYRANRDSELFRFLKRMDMLFRLEESGLVRHLDDIFSPKSMVLFGSASLGEDIRGSDIDIFMECKGKEPDLSGFEKKLKRSISLMLSPSIKDLPKELKNNVINGIKLGGYLEVF